MKRAVRHTDDSGECQLRSWNKEKKAIFRVAVGESKTKFYAILGKMESPGVWKF